MDPNKSATAPPAGWGADEKSVMGQPQPPPYQDHPQYPNAAYPGPAQGYPPHPQGYGPPPQYGGAAYAPYPMAPGQHYPAQPGTAAVTVQPTVYVTRAPLATPINDYMGYSVFTMLCCCLPLGIAALIYSISTRDANHAGDQLAAERSSKMARLLNHVSLGIGITVFSLSVIYSIVFISNFH
ncbi:proline rich transmembrane protein 1B isoform 1-T1 [Polymixia lowei]